MLQYLHHLMPGNACARYSGIGLIMLVSCCLQDGKMKLWDLRKIASSAGSTHTASAAGPECLHTFAGFKHGIVGCAAYMQTAISWRRSKVAVTSLQVRLACLLVQAHCALLRSLLLQAYLQMCSQQTLMAVVVIFAGSFRSKRTPGAPHRRCGR